ncbi:hypothetical protein SDRG_16888 [Saprolegnia diclina VS20]|uniref:Uncharacterized protein n=1 Tax=Saprolegnia diclina (strain VS20) TaxID=1156394 RepID=T0PW42_SAPDV|nr:hypothetical protein SDRG_16888 [Saprolegnia diclina VS20]EQC25250.1 hypothetical protein SDRG_16888 [Saprolegnia diclina VS20]|eukprot:XP_008621334.1 hypothetical protein SDRG_16888 [Saprolegnia diclina VS20]
MHASVKKAHKIGKTQVKSAKRTPKCVGTEVSVLGDATYCVKGSACSGSSKAGVCPLASSAPIADCVPGIASFDPSTQTCSLPADATCTDLGNGAFGCVLELATPTPTTASASTESGNFTCTDTEVRQRVLGLVQDRHLPLGIRNRHRRLRSGHSVLRSDLEDVHAHR